MDNLKDTVINGVISLLSNYSEFISSKEISDIINIEFDVLEDNQGIKILDLNDTINSGYYIYKNKHVFELHLVKDFEKKLVSIDSMLISEILVFAYAGRFVYWMDNTDLELIKKYVGQLNKLIKEA